MKVQFDFAAAYADLLGPKTIQVSLDGEQSCLLAVVAAFFKEFPQYEEVLRKENLTRDNKLVAMFVCKDSLLNDESILTDGAVVRVLSPICGG